MDVNWRLIGCAGPGIAIRGQILGQEFSDFSAETEQRTRHQSPLKCPQNGNNKENTELYSSEDQGSLEPEEQSGGTSSERLLICVRVEERGDSVDLCEGGGTGRLLICVRVEERGDC